jgi:hypothetical protein
MKLKQIYKLLAICGCFTLLFSSCEKDNYSGPDAGIKGMLIDAETNEPFQAGAQSRIRLIEVKYGDLATPQNSQIRNDGTYENSPIFSGKYKAFPIEGAFFPADTIVVDLQGLTEVNFKVIPFLRVTATATASAGSVSVTYKLSRSKVDGKIKEARVLVSQVPTVTNSVADFSTTRTFATTVTDDIILAAEYTDIVTGLTSGNTYYVRVSALATNALSSYNYSPVMKVTIP